VAPLAAEIIVAQARGSEEELNLGPGVPGLRIAPDKHSGAGPLGGIHAGLSQANSYHALVVACDMPFLNERLLRHMIDVRADYDVVMPRPQGLTEPLHAIYSKRCLEPLEAVLKDGGRKIVDFLPGTQVLYMEDEEVRRYDPELLSFFNVNTQADLDRARSLLGRP